MPPTPNQPQPPQHGGQKQPQAQSAAAPTQGIDWDQTISAIEQAMPTQVFALELLREVGHLLNPTPPPQ